MKARTWAIPAILLLVLSLSFLWMVARSAPELPEKVATHFDLAGRPNGWMTRSGAIHFMMAFGLGIPCFILALSALTRVLPPELVNIPNRDYWLAEERRAVTSVKLFRQMLWLACLVVCFMGGMHCLLIRANQSVPPHMPSRVLWITIATFLTAIGLWGISLARTFPRKR